MLTGLISGLILLSETVRSCRPWVLLVYKVTIERPNTVMDKDIPVQCVHLLLWFSLKLVGCLATSGPGASFNLTTKIIRNNLSGQVMALLA